ncbi:MAG: tetratricopeptide repeat protein [Flavobacteriales bacterium]
MNVWKARNNTDTVRLKSLDKLIWDYYLYSNADSAYLLANSGYDFSRRKNLKKEQARFLEHIGKSAEILGRTQEALNCFEKANKIYRQLGDKEGEAICRNSMAIVYSKQGIYNKAIESFSMALEIYTELGKNEGIINSTNNLGIMHVHLNNLEDAAKTFRECYQLAENIGDKKIMANALNNLGNVSTRMERLDSALYYFNKCLPLRRELDDKYGEAATLINIANNYMYRGELDSAEEYFKKGLLLREEIHDAQGVSQVAIGLAGVYYQKRKFTQSVQLVEGAIADMIRQGNVHNLKEANKILYWSYKELKDTEKALAAYENYVKIKDSLSNEENSKNLYKEQFRIDYEKKVYADSIKELEEKKVIQAKFEKERVQRYTLYGGLSLLILFGVFMYNRFRVTRKQKNIIEDQKQEVENQKNLIEEKNKEVIDSISYAKRIQEAYMPRVGVFDKLYKNGFVMYKPKDIVSGDFYWFYAGWDKINGLSETRFVAVADCTGHGVPGALMSVICCNSLNEVIVNRKVVKPAEILNQTREIVKKNLKSEDNSGQKDGMDISLCAVSNNKLQWAGANNPIWIIRKDAEVIEEIKGDKQPIGFYANEKPFTNHELEINTGDTIYLFTDGYQDQFGGEKGKKFKASNLKNLLLSIQKKTMVEQREILENTLEIWRNNLEQVDDVCVIGIRI